EPPDEPVAEASEPESSESDDDKPAEVYQVLERELKAGEVSLDDLERAFRDADGPEDFDVEANAKAAAEEAVA
ncbi:MAG TPA: hypothetical protein DCS30_19960, partial [Rhizobiales bacterium]|nr:hypothetical protein [Hyphomicrobiales bacterium]